MPAPRPKGLSRIVRGLAWLVVGVTAALVIWRLSTDSVLYQFSLNKLDLPSLAMAALLCGMSQLLYCDRWYWFLRAVDVPLKRVEVVYTGLTAQLLSAIAIGSAGGDVYRGVITGSALVGNRLSIITSILADRVAGLYSLVLVAAVAATCTVGNGRWQLVRESTMLVLWSAVAFGGIGILAGLFCRLGFMVDWTKRGFLPLRIISPLVAAAGRFQSHRIVFLIGIATGISVHVLSAAALWYVARGLGVPHPTLAEHCLIGPLATCTALLPLPMAGLGATELVIGELYATAVPNAAAAGMVVAFGGRILSLAVNAFLTAIFRAYAIAVSRP